MLKIPVNPENSKIEKKFFVRFLYALQGGRGKIRAYFIL